MEMQSFFGKQIQGELRKTLQRICKQTGWKHVNLLHINAGFQGSGLPEMLFWWCEIFKHLAGELGVANWEASFDRQAFIEPVILPSGQLLSPDDTLEHFHEVSKKFSLCLQSNTGQIKPLPGKYTVSGNRLVAIQCGHQIEVQEGQQLQEQFEPYFQAKGLQSLLAQSSADIAAQLITEDDLSLYQTVMKVTAGWLQQKAETADYQIVFVHSIKPLGLIPYIRAALPRSVVLWRNHMGTTDPTPVVWNFFAPLINQAHGAVYYLPEYNPSDLPDILPVQVPAIIQLPTLYPFSPKNRELSNLGEPIVKRVMAQYQRDYTLVSKFDLKSKVGSAFLRVTGNRVHDAQIEAVLDSLTKASIRAAFIEEGRRPEVQRFISKSATSQEGMLELVRQLHGIDPARPLFTQISRFDRLKDPVGTTRAFVYAYVRLVRENIPLEQRPQFVYAGMLEDGNSQGFEELVRTFLFLNDLSEEVKEEARDLSPAEQDEITRQLRHDIFILILPSDDRVANAIEVNALQRTSRAVIQKSLCEGFGLAITEAMWKGVPVIGSNTGGIRLQIDHGINGFLAGEMVEGQLQDSVEDTAQYIMTYAKHLDVALRMGEMGKRKVTKEFLMPININLLMRKIADLIVMQR